ADRLADRLTELACHAACGQPCGDATGFEDENVAPEFQQSRRDAGGFPSAGCCLDHEVWRCLQGGEDARDQRIDRESECKPSRLMRKMAFLTKTTGDKTAGATTALD